MNAEEGECNVKVAGKNCEPLDEIMISSSVSKVKLSLRFDSALLWKLSGDFRKTTGSSDNSPPNGFRNPNCHSRGDPSNPTGADRHNRMDECGGSGVSLRSLAGTESRSACIRWRQRYRTFLSGSCAVEISCKCCSQRRGQAGCPCRGNIAVCVGCLCCDHFGRESAGL